MDTELSNAFGWLASNYDQWADNQSVTATTLRAFFNRPDPQPAEQTEWAKNNRQEILDLFAESQA